MERSPGTLSRRPEISASTAWWTSSVPWMSSAVAPPSSRLPTACRVTSTLGIRSPEIRKSCARPRSSARRSKARRDARGEVRLLVCHLGLTDEADRTVAGVGDAVDGEHRGGVEVEVDADEARMVVRHPDEHRRRVDRSGAAPPARRRGRHRARGSRRPARRLPHGHPGRGLLVGEEQDVVVAAARATAVARTNDMWVGAWVSRRSGSVRAKMWVRLPASIRAPALGLYPRLLTACSMRRRVSGETGRLPLSAYDTVLIDTPAASCHLVDLRHADSVVAGRHLRRLLALPRDSESRSASRKRFDTHVTHICARAQAFRRMKQHIRACAIRPGTVET